MEEEFSLNDPTPLLEAATDFAHFPGVQNDAAVKDFLDRFPLPLLINALQTKGDVPGLESTLVACLERVFKTKYGAALIPHYLPFVQVGLKADSYPVQCLACKAVACLLENVEDTIVSPVKLVTYHGIYPLLLHCLVNGDEQVANASMEAIKKLACAPNGMEIVFPANTEATHLGNVASQCSPLGRIRILSLVVKLFATSPSVASAVNKANLLSLLEAEFHNADDTLVTLSVLELFYELAEVQHGVEFLSRSTLLQFLSSLISNASADAILRSRAIMICGRLLSREDTFTFIEDSSFQTVISAIGGTLESESEEPIERESALEALGLMGSTFQGATLLLSMSPTAARYVVDAAFDRQRRGGQLTALHSLGNISGEPRPDSNVLLTVDAEETLRQLIYETASKSSKLTPSGLFWSTLQQDSDIRLAAYRTIAGLVSRPWCLMEICSKQEIINFLTDPDTETTKIGMEARYGCCKAIHKAFFSSSKLSSNPALTGIGKKLQEAVSRGPYLTGRLREAQPMVQTAERF